jgi:hypothetical protein
MKRAIHFVVAPLACGLLAGCNLNPQPLPPETFASSDGGQAGGSGSASSSSGGASGGTGTNGSSGGGSGSSAGGSGSGGFVNFGDAGSVSGPDATVDAGGGPLGGDASVAQDAASGLDASLPIDAASDSVEENQTVIDAFTSRDAPSDVAREVGE